MGGAEGHALLDMRRVGAVGPAFSVAPAAARAARGEHFLPYALPGFKLLPCFRRDESLRFCKFEALILVRRIFAVIPAGNAAAAARAALSHDPREFSRLFKLRQREQSFPSREVQANLDVFRILAKLAALLAAAPAGAGSADKLLCPFGFLAGHETVLNRPVNTDGLIGGIFTKFPAGRLALAAAGAGGESGFLNPESVIFGNEPVALGKGQTLVKVRRILAVGAALTLGTASSRTALGKHPPGHFGIAVGNQALPMGEFQTLLLVGGILAVSPALVSPAAATGPGLTQKFPAAPNLLLTHQTVGLGKLQALLGMANVIAVGAAFRFARAAPGAYRREPLGLFGFGWRCQPVFFSKLQTGILVSEIITVGFAESLIGAVTQFGNRKLNVKGRARQAYARKHQ